MRTLRPAAVITQLLIRLQGLLRGIRVRSGFKTQSSVVDRISRDRIVESGIAGGGVGDQVVELLIAAAETVRESPVRKVGAAGNAGSIVAIGIR